MRKILLITIMSMFVLSIFAGCAPVQEIEPQREEGPSWEIVIEGVDGAPITFTGNDAADLEMIEFDTVLKRRDGSEEQQHWRGIPLKAVLEAVGAGDFSSVTVEGADGYSQEYSLEIVNRRETILGLELNGVRLDEELGPVQMVPKDEPARMFVRNLAKIIVVR